MSLPTHFSQWRVLRGQDRSRECLICDSLGPSNAKNGARNCARTGSLKGAEISCQNKDATAAINNHLQQMPWFSSEPSLRLALIRTLGSARSKGPGGKGTELQSFQRTLTYMTYLSRL